MLALWFYFLITFRVRTCECEHHSPCSMWTSLDNLQVSVLSFYPESPRDETQAVRLGNNCRQQRIHLTQVIFKELYCSVPFFYLIHFKLKKPYILYLHRQSVIGKTHISCAMLKLLENVLIFIPINHKLPLTLP